MPPSELVAVSRRLNTALGRLRFAPPVTHVYNPLEYARAPHEAYLEAFGGKRGRVLLLGMNPGPFGMAQTGVPFGDVALVRDWLGLHGKVGKPDLEHPKRRVEGFGCPRREVSGSRLWGWAKARFGTPAAFFDRFFVFNYCPLAFMEESGRNRTPDKLPRGEREALYRVCDEALAAALRCLAPALAVGVGGFAEKRLREVDEAHGLRLSIGCVLHPSPASPRANRGWGDLVEQDLAKLGVHLADAGVGDTTARNR